MIQSPKTHLRRHHGAKSNEENDGRAVESGVGWACCCVAWAFPSGSTLEEAGMPLQTITMKANWPGVHQLAATCALLHFSHLPNAMPFHERKERGCSERTEREGGSRERKISNFSSGHSTSALAAGAPSSRLLTAECMRLLLRICQMAGCPNFWVCACTDRSVEGSTRHPCPSRRSAGCQGGSPAGSRSQ